MKKFMKISSVFAAVFVCAVMLAACGTTHDAFSAGKVKTAYQSAGFTVDEIQVYGAVNFETMANVDKAFKVTKDADSAVVVVFNIPGTEVSWETLDAIRGSGGYAKSKNNVTVCRYVVNGTTVEVGAGLNLSSPEIIALNKPLTDASTDTKMKK